MTRTVLRPAARRAAAAVAALLVTAGVADAAVPREVGSMRYTTKLPGTATGNVLDWTFRNPEDPHRKPHTAIRMVVHGPPGGVIDTSAPPQCQASDAELMALGPAACPASTRIGTGYAVSDTGGGGPFPRYSRATISNFNDDHEVIGVAELDSIPLLHPVDRTRIEGESTTTSTTDFPLFPGAPPPDPYTPFKRLHVEFPRYVRNGRAYMRTPATCPRAGYWAMTIEFTYADGVKETVVSRSPCERAKKKPHRRHHHPRRPVLHDELDDD
jgi:hypothetical protein